MPVIRAKLEWPAPDAQAREHDLGELPDRRRVAVDVAARHPDLLLRLESRAIERVDRLAR